MKHIRLAVLGLTAAALLALPATTHAATRGVVNSPHDFSGETWNIVPSDPSSVCGVCHQPHHADSSVVPLWIHTTTVSTFTMYKSNAVGVGNSKMVATPDNQPGGVSKACLSCHDGTVAVNSYAGGLKGGNSIFVTNNANLGTDLTHTHPISFTYDTPLANADGGLHDPSASVLRPDSGQFDVGTDISIKNVLLNGGDRLECSSCHDVHNQVGTPFDITTNPKLVKIVGTQGGKGSLLCRSCHTK
jgi:hypothetical protein